MAKLEAMLEQRGVVTPREMSEAIARCQLHGGDLTTSLLQFVRADEAELSAVLSECYGLPAAPVGLLPAADDAASRSLPRDVAERFCCFPLEAGPGRLVLAVAHPFDAALKEELGLTLGVMIEERVALEVRIRQALARFYGLPMSARNQRGIARLEGDLEAAGHETPLGLWSDTQLSTLPRPPSGEPLSFRDSQRPPSVRPRSRSETPRFGVVTAPPVSMERAARRRAPLSLASAREELGRAATRNEALDIFFCFASQSFEYSALFAVHSSLAEGLDAWGKGADRETVLGIGVPLDLPSSLSEAAESCKVRLTRLGKEGIDRTLMADLQRQHNNKALVLPVSLRGRCAVLLYADNGEADVLEREITDLVALAPDIANALGRIILQRKKDAARQKSIDPGESESPLPPRRSSPAHESAVALRSPSSPAAPEVRGGEARKPGRGATGSRPDATAALLQSAEDVSPHPMVAIGPNGRQSSRARQSSPNAAPAPVAPATPLPPSAEDPVFLLARPHAKGAPASTPSPSVPKPPISITHPARLVASGPRLPSVIVDPESADPEASERATRAAAITRAPTQMRSSIPARRPAVPPAADAPRALGSSSEEGARSLAAAATTIPAGRSRVLDDAAPYQHPSGIVSADSAARGPESDELFESSGSAWPPPIMDNSPPPRHQPLTALVPIIIADPPKGRRGYGAVRGNAARGAQRPSSSPAPGPASPTLPSPARVRRADPMPGLGKAPAVAAHVVARAEPGPLGPVAREPGAVASAAPAVATSLSDVVVAATAAAAPTVLRVASAASADSTTSSAEPSNGRPASSANAPTIPASARSVQRASGPSSAASATLAASRSLSAASPTARPAATAIENTTERGSRPPLAAHATGTRSATASTGVVAPANEPRPAKQPAPSTPAAAPLPARPAVAKLAASAAPSAPAGPGSSAGSAQTAPQAPVFDAARSALIASAAARSAAVPSAPQSSSAPSPGPRLAFAPPGSPSIPHAVGSLPAQLGSSTPVSAPAAVEKTGPGSASAITIPARPPAASVSISPSVTITVAGSPAKPEGAASAVVAKPASSEAIATPSAPPPSGTITARPRDDAASPPDDAPASVAKAAPVSTTPVASAASPANASAAPESVVVSPSGDRQGAERPAIFPPAPPDAEIEELVESVCQGNLKAVHELARMGAHGLEQVMARFPGPVISERAGPIARASECGPLLQALAAIGSPAMPSITKSSEHDDARVRRWATLLLGEMPGPEACRAVVQRLADDVPRVHQAALDAARLLLASPAADLFRSTLFEVAEAEEAPLTLRLRTLEHVAKLKDSASVPRLMVFLGADLEPIVHKALWALTVVTRHDYGRDASAWAEFWQKNKARHRLEWLIEALDEHDPRLRKAAADELREEAGDLYGYTEDLPEAERHAAQEKLRQWWLTTGAARHVRAAGSA